MIGPELREVVEEFSRMPTEEFLARLVKCRVPGASVVGGGGAVERGPEAGSHNALEVSEVDGLRNSETEAVPSKEREKKRHRDGFSSRGHHSKKFEEPVMCPSPGAKALVLKIGGDSSVRTPVVVEASDETAEGRLRVCKSYVDKVFTLAFVLLFLFSCFFKVYFPFLSSFLVVC